MTAALEVGEWSAAHPGRTLPPEKTRYLFYRRLGGPQGRSGRAENLVPTRIRSRTVQPVAQSLYRLSYPAHAFYGTNHNKYINKLSKESAEFLVSNLTIGIYEYIYIYICIGPIYPQEMLLVLISARG